MKTASLLITVLMLFAAPTVMAKSWNFDCGNRQLDITPNNQTYPLQADYKNASATMKLVGDKDFERDNEGFLVDIFRLIDPTNYNFQVILQYTETIGTKVWAQQIDAQTNQSEDFQCTLKSFKK
ncbi:hypothetical protein B9G69_009315 [Bdellovibrio sp. SKB1291214]|uniref:hypothetical protein n=1 Tax=Bdellovibrio sp. SKB1291214 TaxID=1732569 RepID=UPI000B51865C|nr:hypothetical protein [Bdellovibrio sp. SKB1291214]UYL07244.1 hypothetical protein B9G69_009315 [Bdellovibrio sp. SKB1291214]